MAFGFARAIGWALSPWYYKIGYGITAACRAIKRRGYGYRERTMRQDISKIYSRMEREGPVKRWVGDVTPSREIISDVELRQPERTYRIFGEMDYYDWDTREWKTKNISFYDDYLRTKEDWEKKFVREWSNIYLTNYNQTIYGVNIFAIEHNKGHLY